MTTHSARFLSIAFAVLIAAPATASELAAAKGMAKLLIKTRALSLSKVTRRFGDIPLRQLHADRSGGRVVVTTTLGSPNTLQTITLREFVIGAGGELAHESTRTQRGELTRIQERRGDGPIGKGSVLQMRTPGSAAKAWFLK